METHFHIDDCIEGRSLLRGVLYCVMGVSRILIKGRQMGKVVICMHISYVLVMHFVSVLL